MKKIIASMLHRIAPLALAIFSMGTLGYSLEQNPIVVPFELTHNEILVHARVNGQGPFIMMLDTDTDPSAIQLDVARRLRLKLKAVGEKGAAFETSLSQVRVGGLKADKVNAIAADLSGLSKRLGARLDGVLGYSFLQGRIVQIDYPGHVVRFFSSSPYSDDELRQNSATRSTLHFTSGGDVDVEDGSVNGQNVHATLDTGSSGSVMITPKAIKKLGLTHQAQQAAGAESEGFSGKFASKKGQIDQLRIGKINIEHPAAMFWAEGSGHDEVFFDINVGNAILKDFVVTLDYPKSLVTLARNSGQPALQQK